MNSIKPSLFGLNNSNRNFSNAESWGKNQFNSSFPASLCCYMHSINMDAIYLKMGSGAYTNGTISIKDLFGIDPVSNNAYFAFESQDLGFQRFVEGHIPRTDLVIQDLSNDESRITAFLEVKLTALPDNSTCDLPEKQYGSELVIRPDTIVYQATSIAKNNLSRLNQLATPTILGIKNWIEPEAIIPHLKEMGELLKELITDKDAIQTPLLLQPVWKTKGKSPELAEDCLDVFVWSDLALGWFILQIANTKVGQTNINRQTRTLVWLFKMLLEIGQNGKVSHGKIINDLSYNTKNDKAFSSPGIVTSKFMTCKQLESPRIKKSQIKNIILGNGQKLLSPERRFDAIVCNSPELFS